MSDMHLNYLLVGVFSRKRVKVAKGIVPLDFTKRNLLTLDSHRVTSQTNQTHLYTEDVVSLLHLVMQNAEAQVGTNNFSITTKTRHEFIPISNHICPYLF